MGTLDRNRRKRRWRVSQYGMSWSLDRAAVRNMLEAGAAGREYDLDHLGNRLKTAPCPTSWDIRPLDWDEDAYAQALKQFDEGSLICG
jgi:hypothetical protein